MSVAARAAGAGLRAAAVRARPRRPRRALAAALAGGGGDGTGGVAEVAAAAARAMRAADSRAADACADRAEALLGEALRYGASDGGAAAAPLLRVVLAMCRGSAPSLDDARRVSDRALSALLAAAEAGGWELSAEGERGDSDDNAPEALQDFDTIESIIAKMYAKKRARAQQQKHVHGRQGGQHGGARPSDAGDARVKGRAAHTELYRLLSVSPDATQQQIKSAYRSLAKQWHPDVNADPAASQIFSALADAYDVLSDAGSRALYDAHGREGMKAHDGAGAGADAGRGNAAAVWAEMGWREFDFTKKPRKVGRREAARIRAAAAAQAQGESGAFETVTDAKGLSVGTVVEYPLRENDIVAGVRSRGVGLLVARNADRGDARTLSEELTGMCELEPLTTVALAGDGCEVDAAKVPHDAWVKDPMEVSAYAHMRSLTAIESSFTPAAGLVCDYWVLRSELSEECGPADAGTEEQYVGLADINSDEAPRSMFMAMAREGEDVALRTDDRLRRHTAGPPRTAAAGPVSEGATSAESDGGMTFI